MEIYLRWIDINLDIRVDAKISYSRARLAIFVCCHQRVNSSIGQSWKAPHQHERGLKSLPEDETNEWASNHSRETYSRKFETKGWNWDA